MPDLEGRGFKVAHDKHGPAIDPDRGDRVASPGALADARAYLARRFPALAGAQLNEERVCQYENSSNGDLLIDRHPTATNVLLVGAGSGHGFKHGPEVGRYAGGAAHGKAQDVGAALQPGDARPSSRIARCIEGAAFTSQVPLAVPIDCGAPQLPSNEYAVGRWFRCASPRCAITKKFSPC